MTEGKVSNTTDAFQFSAARPLALSETPSQPTVVPTEKPEDVAIPLLVSLLGVSASSATTTRLPRQALRLAEGCKPAAAPY